MKKIITLILLIITTSALLAQESATVGNKQYIKEDGEWFEIYLNQTYKVVENIIVIKYKPEVTPSETISFSDSFNLTLYYYDNRVDYYVYYIPENEDIIDLLIVLQYHELIKIAEVLSYGYFLSNCDDPIIPDDPDYPADPNQTPPFVGQWYLPKIEMDCAWNIETGKSNVIVALLDSGVDHDHEDLGQGQDDYSIFTGGWNFYLNSPNTIDLCPAGNCHGTKMAGLIAAKTNNGLGIAGVAGGWNSEGAKIMPYVVFNYIAGNFVVDPIYWAKAIDSTINAGVKIINMSFGGTEGSYMDDKLEYAYQQGVLLIASSGNHGGHGGPVSYPANHPDVIAVGATNQDDTRWIHSNLGPDLELAAPGSHIWTTDGVEYIYSLNHGTSASSAIVSGIAALLWSYNPCFRNEEIRLILRTTADKVGPASNYQWDPLNPGHSLSFGYGRVNAYNAMVLASEFFSDLIITENTTWINDEMIRANLIIESGATLTINSKVELDVNSKIVVKQGAKLIINSSTLTNSTNCSAGHWQGIEVWGNNQTHQFPNAQGNLAQGYLELNDAVIENAINAVSLWKPNDYSATGGIVIANNTVFRNNKKSVHALHYTNFHPGNGKEMDYRASFTRCSFELDENYHGAEMFYKHVDLASVNGVKFSACHFSLSPLAPDVSEWNSGIAGYSAGFSVVGICTLFNQNTCIEYDPSTFTGFTLGAIDVKNTQATTRTFKVKHALFNGNAYGIRVSGINNFTVLNSVFNIAHNSKEMEPCDGEGKSASGFGIHMTGCTGFAIEENYFTKASGAPTGNYTGIYIAETQAADHVYRNTFDGLSYGNYAVGKNWYGNYTWQGLAYYCNENLGNTQDIKVVMNTNNPPRGGVQNPIGSTSLPSGNLFSNNAVYHINNLGEHWFGYYYYAPSPGYTNTPYYPATVHRVTREEVVGIQNQCPTNYGGGGSGSTRDVVMTPAQMQQAEMEYVAGLSDYNNVTTLYDNLKDGGSTTATLTDITTACPSDMWELRAELLGKSPHLSMDVLKATADRTDVLPESVIFEIMAANPDELKKEELIKYLEVKDNPLPEYMVDILRQVAMGSSYKTVLQRQMAHYGQLKTRAAHNIIRSLLNDTISNNDELRNWLDNIGGKRADEQIIASYLSEGNFTNALALANMMPALYNYTGNEVAEHSYYMDMLNLQINLEQQQRSIFDLDSLEVANLLFIAENSHGTAGVQAKGILEYAYGYHFCNCIETDESGLKRGKPFNPASLEKLSGIEIMVVPNPAKEWAAFNYTLPENATSGVIVISDASGREVASMPVNGRQGQQIWDTRAVKPGVYFYTLSAGGFSKHGKIVISK